MVLDRRFLSFCAVGVLNTAFGYSLFALLVFAGLHRGLALFVATCAGVLFNFFSTGRIVFGNRDASRLPRFVATYVAVYLVNLAFMEILIGAGTGVYVGGAIAMLLATVVAYLLQSRLVFKGEK